MSKFRNVLFFFILTLLISPNSQATYVMGHRGARGEFSENTIPGFLYAIEKGVDIIEMDVRLSKDNKLVVTHHSRIDIGNKHSCRWKENTPSPLTEQKKIVIAQTNASDLQHLQCGRKAKDFPHQKTSRSAGVPTFQKVMKAILEHPRGSQVQFSIEMKPESSIPHPWASTPDPLAYAQVVVEALDHFQIWDQTYIDSFAPSFLKAIRSLRPSAKTTLSLMPIFGHTQLHSYSKSEIKNLFNRVHIATLFYSPSLVKTITQYLHSLDVEIIINDAHELKDWEPYLSTGIDGISTDYPSPLIQFLNQ